MGKTPEEIKDLTREYHEAIQDLRAEIKRVREYLSEANIRKKVEVILDDMLSTEGLINRISKVLVATEEEEDIDESIIVEDHSKESITGNKAAIDISKLSDKILNLVFDIPEMEQCQFILFVRDRWLTPSLDGKGTSQKLALRTGGMDKHSLLSARNQLIETIDTIVNQMEG